MKAKTRKFSIPRYDLQILERMVDTGWFKDIDAAVRYAARNLIKEKEETLENREQAIGYKNLFKK